MGSLKEKNVNTCLEVLKSYLDETPGGRKKESAVLALEQLQRVNAGIGNNYTCHTRPLVDGSTGV